MEGSKTILVPVDFQDASLAALTQARDLAGRLGMTLTLLHVFTIPIVVYPGFEPIVAPGIPEKVAGTARDALERLANANGGASTLLRSGDTAAEILQAIEETKPAMVVMGTHGRKGVSRFLIGSIAEKIVRESAVPVLTVRAAAA